MIIIFGLLFFLSQLFILIMKKSNNEVLRISFVRNLINPGVLFF